MKKNFTFLIALIVIASAIYQKSFAQWAPNGTNIYNTNTGNVGVGTNAPLNKLQVYNTSTDRTLSLNNTATSTTSKYGIYNEITGNSSATKYGFYNNLSSAGTGKKYGFYNFCSSSSTSTGSITGIYNDISNLGSGSTTGIYSNISNPGKAYKAYGVYSRIFYSYQDDQTDLYGIYSTMDTSSLILQFPIPGTRKRIGVFSKSYGDNNFAFYGLGRSYFSDDVMVGTTNPASGYILSVRGKIICEELKVQLESSWPDYVFDEDYKRMSINELEIHLKKNKHLPGIPSASEMETNGLSVGEMQVKTMEKIEELTLYIIDLNRKMTSLEKENKLLQVIVAQQGHAGK